jgi:hypothetical protein
MSIIRLSRSSSAKSVAGGLQLGLHEGDRVAAFLFISLPDGALEQQEQICVHS